VIVRVVADEVDTSSADIPTGGPVYMEAFSDQAQTTFDQLDLAQNGSARPGKPYPAVDLGL
jgi:hypothetical protein